MFIHIISFTSGYSAVLHDLIQHCPNLSPFATRDNSSFLEADLKWKSPNKLNFFSIFLSIVVTTKTTVVNVVTGTFWLESSGLNLIKLLDTHLSP